MAVAVVHNDQPVYLKGFGVRELGSDALVDENTVFQLASLSKPVGATVVASVVGDGDVSWDDPVTTHLPGFALGDPYVTANVTIADLVAHVTIHEFAHHFGWSDDDIAAIDQWWH